jgi:hypothetical protein
VSAREKAGTARIWMKSARLEWVLGNVAQAKDLVSAAVLKHPLEPKVPTVHTRSTQVSLYSCDFRSKSFVFRSGSLAMDDAGTNRSANRKFSWCAECV